METARGGRAVQSPLVAGSGPYNTRESRGRRMTTQNGKTPSGGGAQRRGGGGGDGLAESDARD
jgi:hypothetical protein